MTGKTTKKKWSFDFDFSMTLGSAYSKFMEGLENREFRGNKAGDRTYYPPKDYCFKTLEKPTEWVVCDGTGTIEAFTICYRKDNHVAYRESSKHPEPPYVLCVIRIADSDCCMLHFLDGFDAGSSGVSPEMIRVGMKVRPVWAENRDGTIMDIRHFVPVE